jgi:methenyltetrahydromethanopterin cyclohydrolase
VAVEKVIQENPPMLDYSKCKPVGDNVLVRFTQREEIGGIRIPSTSVEARIFDVVEIGSDVKRCKPGDRIMPIGIMGKDWGTCPGSHDFILLRDECVAMILDKESMDTPPEPLKPRKDESE